MNPSTLRVERWLKSRIGLDPESIGHAAIDRMLHQRMEALGCADESRYVDLLQASPKEQQALVEAVVVPETWFFRYPESFRTLAALAMKAARAAHAVQARPMLRILSLPCSSGEEPCSIVMSLLEAGLPPAAFHVDAVDVSGRHLELALDGVYESNAFRATPGGAGLAYRDRCFTAEGGQRWRINPAVRACISYLQGNLLDERLPLKPASYDFVFCRNLLIYFDRPTQARAMQALHRLLRPGGTFFVGPAEARLFSLAGLRAAGAAQAFAFGIEKPVQAPISAPALAASARTSPRPPMPRPVAAIAPRPDAGASLADLKALADQGQAGAALDAAHAHLNRHGPSAELYYWLGVLSDATGQADRALEFLRNALYLDPRHGEALVHLATLLLARGDPAGAQRLQQRAQLQAPRH